LRAKVGKNGTWAPVLKFSVRHIVSEQIQGNEALSVRVEAFVNRSCHEESL